MTLSRDPLAPLELRRWSDEGILWRKATSGLSVGTGPSVVLDYGLCAMTDISDLPTPALLVDIDAFELNLATMSTARPGLSLRPHIKAFKSTSVARMSRRRTRRCLRGRPRFRRPRHE